MPPTLSEKFCRICEETKPLEDFGSHRGHADGKQNYCRPCRNALNRNLLTPEQRAAKARNALRYVDRRKVNRRGMRYGITEFQFAVRVAEQEGRCAICRKDETYEGRMLCVDHDHRCCTGCIDCVRGLLCSRCNKALGGFNDDPELLQSAIVYLRHWAEVRQEELAPEGNLPGPASQ